MPLRNKIVSRKLLIFLLCLVASTFVWLINQLAKDYSYDLPYKVCIYSSTNNIENMCANEIMYVKVIVSGFHIIKHRMENVKELNIDIKKLRLTRTVNENNVVEYTLPTALIQNTVKEAIGDVVRMETIVTEELSFVMINDLKN